MWDISRAARFVATTVARRSIGDRIEEQLAADTVEADEALLVDDEDIDAEEALLQTRALAAFLRPGFDAERDREMRLAGADRAGEDQILRRGDPLAARQRVDLRRGHRGGYGLFDECDAGPSPASSTYVRTVTREIPKFSGNLPLGAAIHQHFMTNDMYVVHLEHPDRGTARLRKPPISPQVDQFPSGAPIRVIRVP